MTKKIFAVRDSRIGVFQNPFLMRNAGEALRGFESVVNDPDTQFYRYPDDFTLYELGEFNDESGEFDIHSPAKLLANAKELWNTHLEGAIAAKGSPDALRG